MKIKAILDKRKKITTGDHKGKFPVKIKVNIKLPGGGYAVKRLMVKGADGNNIYCSKLEFKKVEKSAPVLIALGKASELMSKSIPVDEMERLFKSGAGLDEIRSVFDSVIAKLRDEERDGTAESYHFAYSSFKAFKGDNITFQSITVTWLKDYERWGKKRGLSINSIGIYLRALRVIVNTAVDMRLITADENPFGRRKYVIATGQRALKKALLNADIQKLLHYDSVYGVRIAAVDLWRLSYMMNGCNIADIAYLKFKNIIEDPDGKTLVFDRKKTENTERAKKPIEVFVSDHLWEVFERRMNRMDAMNPDAYVFPILRPEQSSSARKERIRDIRWEANKILAEVKKELKIGIDLTLSTARYSAATKLKRAGIDLKAIGKSLGHGSEATTERYTEEEKSGQRLIAQMLVG